MGYPMGYRRKEKGGLANRRIDKNNDDKQGDNHEHRVFDNSNYSRHYMEENRDEGCPIGNTAA